ncbi:MAG: hypothetical protein KatS3mg113_0156 [Planctomycetaceae bacterium]|nr:MAG: hypothetical protein KatS3mg113_0156 [Planctomycetaceae bacterium]
MSESYDSRLRSPSAVQPRRHFAVVTMAMCFTLTSLFVTVSGHTDSYRTWYQQLRAWGGVVELTQSWRWQGHSVVPYPEWSGPFDLWKGEWWRVPLSTLHHADRWHWLSNTLVLAWLGPMLELRWGHARYLLFLLSSMLVVSPVEFLLGQISIGFSGVCCAVFGALWVWRLTDDDLRQQLSEETVWLIVVLLVSLAALTWVDQVSVANGAHLAGLAYGGLTAKVLQYRSVYPRLGFLVAHSLLIPVYGLLQQPFWNGAYHWWLAEQALERRADPWPHWRRALYWNPQLPSLWLMLSQRELTQAQDKPMGNPLELFEHPGLGELHSEQLPRDFSTTDEQIIEARIRAWQWALQGLKHNPVHAGLWRQAWRLTLRLQGSPRRDELRDQAQQILGADLASWWFLLTHPPEPPVLIAPHRPQPNVVLSAAYELEEQLQWQRAVWLPAARSLPPLPAVDPTDPASAREGELM